MFDDWKTLVRNIAPALGTALGGPAGGMAVKFIADKMLGNADASEADVKDFLLSASPEQMVTLRQIDNDFSRAMAQIGVDLERINADDRASARSMAVQTSLNPQIILACIYVLAFSAILYLVFAKELAMSSEQENMANYLLGILSAGLMQIMSFFYGSSKSSQDKNDLLKNRGPR